MASDRSKKPRRSKRKRRFGNIYSRKWGSGRRTWSAKYFCRKERRWLTRAFDTEAEAKQFLDEVEKRILAEAYEVPPTLTEAHERAVEASIEKAPREVPTLIDYAEDVIDRRFEPVLAKGTIGVYRAALRAWTEYFGPRDGQRAVRLDEITPARWLDYRAWRAKTRNSSHGKKKTVSNRTLNADQQCVVRVLNEAVLDGHLGANPLAGIKKLRETRRPRRYLTKEELGRLLANCPEHFRPFVVTAVYTGARKGELLALRWSDIDFDGAKISLYRPKVGNADHIDMHPAVEAELKGLKESRRRELREKGEKIHFWDYSCIRILTCHNGLRVTHMTNEQIHLDGDPRKLGMAIFRAVRESYKRKKGSLKDTAKFQQELDEEVPKLAKEMVEALERDVRDVYLINALEVLALTYARQQTKRSR